MNSLNFVQFICAAGLGGAARYLIELRFPPIGTRAFPRATLAVNIIGSFILGYVISLPDSQRLIFGTALCGAVTTFSGVALQLQRRFVAGSYASALIYLVITVSACSIAAQSGIWLGEYLAK